MSHPIIALWSHPRSMSTAFERIMRARGDLACLHEPFMYDYYINRSTRQMPHFDAMDDHPRSYDAIRDMILARAEQGPVFFKDMSYYVMPHILADEAFFTRVTHSFLIRDPRASILERYPTAEAYVAAIREAAEALAAEGFLDAESVERAVVMARGYGAVNHIHALGR